MSLSHQKVIALMPTFSFAQFNPVIGNPEYNAIRIIEMMRHSKENGSSAVFFGELALSGYRAKDMFYNEFLIHKTLVAWEMVKYASDQLNIGIGLGMPMMNPNRHLGEKHLVNAYRFYSKENEFTQHKVLLPTYGEFDEGRWFQPGSIENVQIRTIGGQSIGIVICEDGWNNKFGVPDEDYRLYREDPIEKLVFDTRKKNARLDAIINISASPDYMGKQKIRLEMNQRIAKAYGVPIVFLNLVGSQDELIFGGRSFIINARGELVKQMAPFREDIFSLPFGEINALKPLDPDSLSGTDPWEELDQMAGLFLKDYMTKNGFSCEFREKPVILKTLFRNPENAQSIIDPFLKEKPTPKCVLGISGGKDSTLVATLIKRHLGSQSLFGIMLPYRLGMYTQQKSLDYGNALAKGLGVSFQTMDITETVNESNKSLKLNEGDGPHQNLQARIRAMFIQGKANETGGLVINTTNFSEAALGYGTIGGDLIGLPILASLPATHVISYLEWLKNHGETALTDDMIHRVPSAELAPGQTDEKTLGAYGYIDPILESIRMNHGDLRKVIHQFSDKKSVSFGKYWETAEKKDAFIKSLKFLSRQLLVMQEYKRRYVNIVPQLTPFGWDRWQWPVANGFMDTNRYIDEYLKEIEGQ